MAFTLLCLHKSCSRSRGLFAEALCEEATLGTLFKAALLNVGQHRPQLETKVKRRLVHTWVAACWKMSISTQPAVRGRSRSPRSSRETLLPWPWDKARQQFSEKCLLKGENGMGRRSNRSIPPPPPFQLQLLAGAGGFMHLSQKNNAATKKFLIFYITLLPNVNNLN